MVTLRIFLVGLIALVADKEKGTLGVVLLDTGFGHHTHAVKHYPLIFNACKNVKDSTDRRNCGVKDYDPLVAARVLSKPTADYGVTRLLNDRISISDAIQPCCSQNPPQECQADCRVKFAGGRRRPFYDRAGDSFAGNVPGKREEAEDFSWVPEMQSVDPAYSRYKFDVSGEIPGRVAGLLEVTNKEAFASTFGFVDMNDLVPSFTFKRLSSEHPMSDYRQALADVVLIKIPLGENVQDVKLILDGKDEQGNPLQRKISLTVFGDESFIDIVVGNIAPLFDGPTCATPPLADEHFEQYYELARAKLPVLREAQIPFIGRRTEKKINVEVDSPPVLSFVEAPVCNVSAGGLHPSSSNRPICTQVVFEP